MFHSKLVLEPIEEREGAFLLVEPLIYHSALIGMVTVPRGFDTDGASIPPIINELWKEGGKKMRAAVVHDWLYRYHPVSKRQADMVFLEAMKVVGVGLIKRYLMYYAVRLFGGFSWKK